VSTIPGEVHGWVRLWGGYVRGFNVKIKKVDWIWLCPTCVIDLEETYYRAAKRAYLD
jgi:hypothetical protein